MGIEFEHQGVKVTVDVQKKRVAYSSSPDKHLVREAQAIALGYIKMHEAEGKFPEFDEAKAFAAYLLMPRHLCQDPNVFTPKELASQFGVTEEFAQYRMSLNPQG